MLLGGVLALVRTNMPVLAVNLAAERMRRRHLGPDGAGEPADLVQKSVADRFRGRVFGALDAMRALLMLVGGEIAGALGDRWGVVAMFNLMSGLYILAGAAGPGAARHGRATVPRRRKAQFRLQPAYC